MRWTYNALGLQPPLSWGEWAVLVSAFGLLIVAGWAIFQFIKAMRGE